MKLQTHSIERCCGFLLPKVLGLRHESRYASHIRSSIRFTVVVTMLKRVL